MKKELTNKQYNLAIGLILLWGFLINAIMCIFFQDTFCNLNPLVVLIGYFAAAIAGICMSYDWAKAQNNRKTLDNAVDSAVSLYLDIINLFLRLLNRSSKK